MKQRDLHIEFDYDEISLVKLVGPDTIYVGAHKALLPGIFTLINKFFYEEQLPLDVVVQKVDEHLRTLDER